MAEAAALLADHGLLDYVHLNDNTRSWDDDMIFASVHAAEHLELVYWLLRSGYKGWLTLDIFPYREEKIPAAVESFAWVRLMIERLQARGLEAIGKIVRGGEGTDAVRLVRELLTGQRPRAEGRRLMAKPTGCPTSVRWKARFSSPAGSRRRANPCASENRCSRWRRTRE